MSIYKKQALVETFPAYVVFRREADSNGFVNITSSELLGLKHPRGFYDRFRPGSVVGYALEYNECPIEAVAQANERGHALHWINKCATALTSHKQDVEVLVEVTVGMPVRFEGKLFTIELDHNDNLKFAPM